LTLPGGLLNAVGGPNGSNGNTTNTPQGGQVMVWIKAPAALLHCRQMRDQAEETRRQELDRAREALARGEDPAAVLDSLSQGLTNKLLHAPTQALKKPTK